MPDAGDGPTRPSGDPRRRPRPPEITSPPPRRRVSRRIRLRRTIAVTLVLLVVVVVSVRLATRGDDADGARSAARDSTTGPSTPSASGGPDSEDGSAVTQTAPVPTSVPVKGTGRVTVVSVPKAPTPPTGRAVRYTVEIEGGLGVDEAEVARTVSTILHDAKGWQRVDRVRFVNVSPAEARAGAHVDIRVTLASPSLTDRLCAPMKTLSEVSCWNGERSVLNLRRWMLGADSHGDDVERYRIYQVNHEVGHGLGHGHRSCPAKGKRAPVMVQQTLGLEGCMAWPYPSGA